jgi:murein L,D-transpeptidase YafK
MRMRTLTGSVSLGAFLAAATLAPGALSPQQQPPNRADSVLILKKDHVLELLSAGKVIRTYRVALGSGGIAPKQREGDGRTPEGHYIIDSRNEHSAYQRRCTSLIPTRTTAAARPASASPPAAPL